MSLKFEFPDTGEGVTEGKFLEWLVEEGEKIEEDQIVGEAETDKAVVDIPAPADGTVEELKVEPGDRVEVGDIIMILETGQATEEENQTDSSSDDGKNTETEEPESQEEEQDEVEVEPAETEENKDTVPEEVSSKPSSADVLALPKVRKLAEQKGVDLASIKTGERITEEEVLEAAEGGAPETEQVEKQVEEQAGQTENAEDQQQAVQEDEKEVPDTKDVKATPAVRKLAREKGVDIGAIEGSGRDGKATREDVMDAAESSKEAGTEEESRAEETGESGKREESVEMSKVRKTIAERMENAKFSAPHVTHVDKADVTRLVELREEENENLDVHLTYLPFIMKAAEIAMKEHPELNAELDEENDEIILKKHYDFNMAVDTDRGLMVPLIEDIDQKNIVELAEEISEKAGKAKHSDLSPEEMRNGTFSVTNLGVIGGEEFTPIIDYPQVAILGIGKIQETPEVVDGEVVPRHTVKLSLSYDHRVVDGATAARFVNTVIENLEDPGKMLVEL